MPVTGVGRYRIRTGDRLRVREIARTAVTLVARVRILYDDGRDDELSIAPFTSGTSGTLTTTDSNHIARGNGWVVGGGITTSSSSVARGTVYVELSVGSGSTFVVLGDGFLYDGNDVDVGTSVENGAVIELTTSGAGNAAVQLTTGVTGSWEVFAILYSYLCDATAVTRTTAPLLFLSGLTNIGPETSEGSLIDTLSLTASQLGEILALGGIRYKNQAGTKSVTVAAHVPFTAASNAGAGPVFAAAAATNGVAGDTHRISIAIRRIGVA